MKFVRIEPFFGCLYFSNDFVSDSSVLGGVDVEEPVALTKKSFDVEGHPGAISWVHLDALNGEVIMYRGM